MTSKDFFDIIKYFSIIHHTHGRIRLRVDPNIVKEGYELSYIKTIIKNIKGINDISVNKIIGSVTIKYDKDILQKDFFDDLIKGKNIEEVLKQLNGSSL